jgi:hypothetical protein
MEAPKRIVDYHLKERNDGQNSKISLSGRKIAWTPAKIFPGRRHSAHIFLNPYPEN